MMPKLIQILGPVISAVPFNNDALKSSNRRKNILPIPKIIRTRNRIILSSSKVCQSLVKFKRDSDKKNPLFSMKYSTEPEIQSQSNGHNTSSVYQSTSEVKSNRCPNLLLSSLVSFILFLFSMFL